ncbi:hypothetical protein [Bythopirellula polymerisocia]|uniref:Uncharacterized protein n=1 Tax=Bythopirellula polymerisocia TaxID=2528003 RepID=A0A5C6CXQ5_9BACT|nr:hypothetical protein [Bythopirellula polymerisocia]TWU27419.1 hypothetical protein Pla144_21920 [Bythopirellula polymerisocia]
MTFHRLTYCALLIAILLVSDSFAQSIGYWHLPSTAPQYCGFGCGPGHHVPMIRTHGCVPPRVPRCVHTRGCLSGGMAYSCSFGSSECPNCHAELDALITPESTSVAPEPAERIFSFPEGGDQQVLPTPQVDSKPLPQN